MADRRNAGANRVQFSPHLLKLGMLLDFTLYDEHGRMLLARRQRIDSQHLLDILYARPALFADQDESREPIKVVMASLEQAMFRNAPLKDIDKFHTLTACSGPSQWTCPCRRLGQTWKTGCAPRKATSPAMLPWHTTRCSALTRSSRASTN